MPLPLSEWFIAGCCRYNPSTYSHQVYDDNRWWISLYLSSDGEILIKPFKFTKDNDGFQLLLSKLDPLDKDSIIIGLESTAYYGDNLVLTWLLVITSTMRKNNIRKTKTDKVDTYMICKTLMMQEALRFVTFYDLDLMDLIALGRFRQKTIKQ